MSHKENDKFLEEVERAEIDLEDARIARKQAAKDLEEAIIWRDNRESWYRECAQKLNTLKNK